MISRTLLCTIVLRVSLWPCKQGGPELKGTLCAGVRQFVLFSWFQRKVRRGVQHAADDQGMDQFDDIILFHPLVPAPDSERRCD